MICLDVSSKGKGLTLAGDPDAMVQACLASGTHIGAPPRPGFAFSINGYTAGRVVEWITRDLFVGDEVLIKVVECSEPNMPTRVLTDSEFDDLGDKKGLLLARGEYAALKRRMRTLEDEYGARLTQDA
jgi:hypothetical protein